ncbi:MAG: hypothetical protein OXU96_11925 [Gammaproteobacteria bacterium]|nr:hypothetical protein [Gammaproteobacteria bacterium]
MFPDSTHQVSTDFIRRPQRRAPAPTPPVRRWRVADGCGEVVKAVREQIHAR